MSSNAAKPIRVFISYPHSNFKVLKELRENLGWLENSGQLEVFDDREILGGDDWNACIKTNLERAEIIIFIVTASFMCSPYCTNIELRSALEQRAKERTRIVPIIAETCDWEAMPIFQIAALPKDEANNLKPLNRWGRGRDVAFTQITQQIRQATEELFRLRASDESRDEIGNESTTALTDAFLPPVQHLERRALERGECFPQITDSVMYLWGVEQNYQEDVLSYLRRGRAIPSRLLYQSFRGTKNWLDLCDDDTYYPFYNSRLNIEENMEKIINALKGKGEDYLSQMPDIISLGPGNGIKDRIILRSFMTYFEKHKLPCECFYYPIDVSIAMLSTAVRCIRQDEDLSSKVKIKCIHGKISDIKLFVPVFDFRIEPNLYFFLGNTLGNTAEEHSLLNALHSAMHPNDAILLETRSKDEDLGELGGKHSTRVRFNFGPLAQVGVPFDYHRVEFVKGRMSQIDDAITIICKYKGNIKIGNESFNDVILSCVNFYDIEKLEKCCINIGFDVRFSKKIGPLNYLLLKKGPCA